ncbi:uncharacterized protein TRAVEDRAFT_47270 [Trametes versicolor FP-101664 SS1]|uniref:uncharacterized protein n=1 Tax=Trametes versicolor (strain FP-101664) TaxID=717944 RepID=UPI000462402C|nr:uncharacterized protein TRAVEDRAFT_47270 [Trametes versicolor FP-101664 SS1]EIW58092.1 hypothetical protein TRAVEDRAFT_47270 [Trametes versicolor FP-101664 SS1]
MAFVAELGWQLRNAAGYFSAPKPTALLLGPLPKSLQDSGSLTPTLVLKGFAHWAISNSPGLGLGTSRRQPIFLAVPRFPAISLDPYQKRSGPKLECTFADHDLQELHLLK